MTETTKEFPSLADALISVFGSRTEIAATTPVSGGDINRACRLMLRDGTQLFMKSNAGTSPSFFRAEAEGLAAIADTNTIRVPQILAIGMDGKLGAFLLLEWIEGARQTPDYWTTFGRRLAAMHRAETSALVSGGKYGLNRDNYIGARRQKNTPMNSWIAFFRDCRLEPQFRDAARWFDATDRKRISYLLEHLDEYLDEPEQPSLLHGDLWSGNFITGSDGNAWLIDPAAYVGHPEADIAMTELFGGFPQKFYDAYQEVNPMKPGYERRREVYNLYHLLNHLNLFGGSYLPSIQRILKNREK